MTEIKRLNTRKRFAERKKLLLKVLKDLSLKRDSPLKILEAGCGKRWGLATETFDYRLTGVDISKEALDVRKVQENDLQDCYVGDLRTIDLADQLFDVVYSNFVLEHIQGAEKVLKRFKNWLRPGGLIILQVPDNKSTAVFATKIIPHFVHILYYKYIVGFKEAGRPGHAPFKAYYDSILSIEGLNRFATENHCRVVLARSVKSPYKYFGFISLLLFYLSFKRLSHKHNGLLFVFERVK